MWIWSFAALNRRWFGGYLAPQMEPDSAFWAFLDPVADKLMEALAAALIVLVGLARVDAIVRSHHHRPRITISALRNGWRNSDSQEYLPCP